MTPEDHDSTTARCSSRSPMGLRGQRTNNVLETPLQAELTEHTRYEK